MLRRFILIAAVLMLAGGPVYGKGRATRPTSSRVRKAKARAKASAERRQRPPKLTAVQRLLSPWKKLTGKQKGLISRFRERRLSWIRSRGTIFHRITQKRDYSRDYVVSRNKKVTALLDWSDPQHPQYDPSRHTGEQHLLDPIPENKRAHVLVIPNKPREHIAQNLGAQITADDLDAARATMKEAEKIAAKLGIKKPRIWINSPSRISVGYLHVHIIGERAKPYPKAIAGE